MLGYIYVLGVSVSWGYMLGGLCPRTPRKVGGGGGGLLEPGKGYYLRSHLSGAVAVASQDGYKKGGCSVIVSSQRVAVIVLIVILL